VDDATAARIQYASLLLARYTAEGNVSDLVHAGTLWEKALPGLDGDPALPACLTKYASVLYERFNVTREAGLLQLAVSRQEEALALAAAHDPDLCLMQVSLAVMLSGHLTGSEGSGKLDRAVALVLAAESAATRHDSRLMLAVYMASVLLSQQGADAHLGTVERMTSAALRDAPPSAPRVRQAAPAARQGAAPAVRQARCPGRPGRGAHHGDLRPACRAAAGPGPR
jgi:hypothetical protein